MRKLFALFAVFGMFAPAAFAYDKIDWNAMDTNKDGYISPQEMVDHYKKAGVYK